MKKSSAKLLPAGTILLTTRATIGEVAIATEECTTNQGFQSLVVNKDANSIFISNWIKQNKSEFIKRANGSTFSEISKSEIEEIPILLPLFLEQQKIASFLSLIDERISTQSKIIDRLESLIEGVSKSLLNNKSTNIKLNDCLICHSSTLMEGNVYDSLGDYPVYGAVGVVAHTDSYDIDEDAILIIKDGAGVGRVQYAKEKHSVTGTLNYLTPKAGIHLKYMYYCLRIFNFDKYKVGSGIPHIYFKDYGHEYIYCPPVEKQQRIASILSAIDKKIEIDKSILEEYTGQKKYLLKQMFI